MSVGVERLMTAEQLWELPGDAGKRFELVRGELVEVPGAGGAHGLITRTALLLLHPFVAARGLGEVFGDGVGFIISRDPDAVRIADVSFVSKDRLPQGAVPEGYFPFAPDLAVEIVSPNDRADDVHGKVREYLEAGARMVWVFWPRHRAVTLHTPGEVWELREDDEIDGGDVLPRFRVRVGELFGPVG